MNIPKMCKEFLEATYDYFRDKPITSIYKNVKWYNIKSTEFGIQFQYSKGQTTMVVSIAGSNDAADWILNIFLGTWRGYKFAGWMEAKRVLKEIKKLNYTNLPIILTGHSKSGATLPPLTALLRKAGYHVDSIHSFEPATSMKHPKPIEGMVIYIDPDDKIPNIGKPFLKHPVCRIVEHPGGKSGNDHSLSNWDNLL